MTPIWRYLTHPAGMTAQTLAESAKMTVQEVRADLVKLESEGRVRRQRAAVGQPHRWWRAGSQPLDGDEVMLHMALAAYHNPSADKLREVLADVGRRAKNPAHQKIVTLCATARAPHQVVWAALAEYEIEVELGELLDGTDSAAA